MNTSAGNVPVSLKLWSEMPLPCRRKGVRSADPLICRKNFPHLPPEFLQDLPTVPCRGTVLLFPTPPAEGAAVPGNVTDIKVYFYE